MDHNKELKAVVARFFERLGATVVDNGSLEIRGVPKKFEAFYGKEGPYQFVFNAEQKNSFPQAEPISRGHHLLRTISEFLKQKGKTTVVRLRVAAPLPEEISKQFGIQNARITNLSTQEDYVTWHKFTFMTTIQYRNEKETIFTEVLLDEERNLQSESLTKRFVLVEGKQKDKGTEEVKECYAIAKGEMKKRLRKKVEEIEGMLRRSLKREEERIKSHYTNLSNEIVAEYQKAEEQFLQIRSELDTASEDERPQLLEKLIRINQLIERTKKDGKREQLEKEKAFFLSDEQHKHSIALKNELMNVTIIFVPKQTLTGFLKRGRDVARQFSVEYDVLVGRVGRLRSDISKELLEVPVLTDSGHIVAQGEVTTCPTCGATQCELVRAQECSVSKKPLCPRCRGRCEKTWRYVSKDLLVKDFITGKMISREEAGACSKCGSWTDKAHLKRDQETMLLTCPKCTKKVVFRG